MKTTKLTALFLALLVFLCCTTGCGNNTYSLESEPLPSKSVSTENEETEAITTNNTSQFTTKATTTKPTTTTTTNITTTTSLTTKVTTKSTTTIKKTTTTTKKTTTTTKKTTTTTKKTTTTTTEAINNNDSSKMVWIPRSGSKYHSYSGCSNMKNPTQVTLDEAKAMGYTACKRCH